MPAAALGAIGAAAYILIVKVLPMIWPYVVQMADALPH
jgi:hypothetical protein